MHVLLNPSIEINTLSGRRSYVPLQRVKNVGELKQRIVEERGHDNEIGTSADDFDLYNGRSLLSEVNKPLPDLTKVRVVRKR